MAFIRASVVTKPDLTVGKVLGDGTQGLSSYPFKPVADFSANAPTHWHCPCALANWEYAQVYQFQNGWQADVESLAGLQFTAHYDKRLSATVQLVSRADNGTRTDYVPTVDWAYVTWKPTENWTLQAGRKRIPFSTYSDYLYIGYAFPWVRAPQEVYGYQIYAYDGFNVAYQHYIGDSDWVFNNNIWWGNKTNRHDAFSTLFDFGAPTNHEWSNIFGDWASVTNGPIEIRAVMTTYHESIWQQNSDGTHAQISDKVFTRVKGASANVDYKNFVVRTEISQISQNPGTDYKFNVDIYLASIGYRIGPVLPLFTQARYSFETTTVTPREGQTTRSVGLRWDFHKNMALKVQYDLTRDHSEYPVPFIGDSKLIAVSLQGVF